MNDVLLRLTSSKGDTLWIGVRTDPDTGTVVPLAEVEKDTRDMWLAIADGVAVIAEADDGERIVMAPLDWIEKTFPPEDTNGLDRIREVLREEGMLPPLQGSRS